MEPNNPSAGTNAPLTSPRHGLPPIAGRILKLVSSLVFIDVLKTEKTVEDCFAIVQGYCNQQADLS